MQNVQLVPGMTRSGKQETPGWLKGLLGEDSEEANSGLSDDIGSLSEPTDLETSGEADDVDIGDPSLEAGDQVDLE